MISPMRTSSKYFDETYDLWIVAKSSGNSMAFLASKFEFLKLHVPEGMSGPKFEMAPPVYTIMYNFDSSGYMPGSRQD